MLNPSQQSESFTGLLPIALACIEAHISVIPVSEDGTKRPAFSWKAYQERLPNEQELQTWYQNGRTGIGAVTGAVSDNLEVLDFESRDTFVEFIELAHAADLGELTDRLLNGY